MYFVDDSQSKDKLLITDLRPAPLTSVGLGSMTRASLVRENAEWWFDGADDLEKGHFIVKSIATDNNYVCVRRTGGGGKNIEEFDIGHVMRTICDARERMRVC